MSKYHNIKKTCFSGHKHASKFEANYCNRLLAMKQKGEIWNYLTQVKFELAGGIKHIVDFTVTTKKDTPYDVVAFHTEVHECKGIWTAVARLKKKLFEEKYPNIPYKVIYKKQRRPR